MACLSAPLRFGAAFLIHLSCLCCAAADFPLDVQSDETLTTPPLSSGNPSPGKRVAITPAAYAGTDVFHTLFLPADWTPDGPPRPIIFEYTGNHFPQAGSTGEVEDAGLGYGISGGQFIWVSLPYINTTHDDNQITWWGDEAATVRYAKQLVPQIISQFNADPNAVFLCGFSRGAIATNYIGLHDDEIARLWTAFVTHDHFDGVREWRGGDWGSPLQRYRRSARTRLARVAGRPYLVLQNGSIGGTRQYLEESLPSRDNFTLLAVNTKSIQGEFPNSLAKAAHNDRWLNVPSAARVQVREWINRSASSALQHRPQDRWGELIFEDRFDRNESQEIKDEPGNGWTTSSDKTAGGHKQVDLRDGTLHIDTHATANHATSVRHTFSFRDGTVALRFLLHRAEDRLKLNFTDLECREVHAGHLYNVEVAAGEVLLLDRKTGEMNLKLRDAKSRGDLSEDQRASLATKRRAFPASVEVGRWHEIAAHVDGDVVSVDIDGIPVARYSSEGFAHPNKRMIRLLVPHTATVDDVRIFCREHSQSSRP